MTAERFSPPVRPCPVCGASTNPFRMMCLRHWRMVPSEIKGQIGRAQRARWQGAYRAAKAAAVQVVREREVARGR